MRLKRIKQPISSGKSRSNAGFTILELMIAASIFSVILLIIAVGVISFTNSYFKGITTSKTQAAARTIMSAFTQSIQFGQSVTTPSCDASGVCGMCIDNTTYTYKLGQEVTDSAPQAAQHQGFHGLVVDTAGCTLPATMPNSANLLSTQRELLGQQMRINTLSVTPIGNLYLIHLRLLSGDDDLFTPTVDGTTDWSKDESCAGIAGNQFCAVADLTTTVEKRLL